MNRNTIEMIVGGAMLAIAAMLAIIVYMRSATVPVSGYVVTARFVGVDGLKTGSEVWISGIAIGRVIGTTIDPTTYDAIVRFTVEESVKLPADTTARIAGSGITGNYVLELQPGHEKAMIAAGGEIPLPQTQVPVNIIDLLGRSIFGSVQAPLPNQSERDRTQRRAE